MKLSKLDALLLAKILHHNVEESLKIKRSIATEFDNSLIRLAKQLDVFLCSEEKTVNEVYATNDHEYDDTDISDLASNVDVDKDDDKVVTAQTLHYLRPVKTHCGKVSFSQFGSKLKVIVDDKALKSFSVIRIIRMSDQLQVHSSTGVATYLIRNRYPAGWAAALPLDTYVNVVYDET